MTCSRWTLPAWHESPDSAMLRCNRRKRGGRRESGPGIRPGLQRGTDASGRRRDASAAGAPGGPRRHSSRPSTQLSPETRVQRWFYPKMRLSDQELDELVCVSDEDHGAIVAIELAADGSEKSGIGMARFVREQGAPGRRGDRHHARRRLAGPWHRPHPAAPLLAMISERGIGYVDGRLHIRNRRMRQLLEPYVPGGRLPARGLDPDLPLPGAGAGRSADGAACAQCRRRGRMFKRMAEGAHRGAAGAGGKAPESLAPRALLEALRRKDSESG
jgi:hypothetical protein